MFGKYKDLFITLTLISVSAVLLFVNLDNVGICWDEANHIGWSIRYAQWFELVFKNMFRAGLSKLFSEQAINYFWVGSNQHPPLVIVLGAWSLGIFRKVIGLINSVRLVSLVSFSVLIGLVFRFGLHVYNRRVGLFSSLCLFFMPRVFGQGLIYGLDMPMALIWFATIFCFVKGLKHKGWGLLTGFFLGLALLTKINAFLLPVVFLIWFSIVLILSDIKKYSYKHSCLSIFFVAPFTVLCLWPQLWRHPLRQIQAYILTKVERMVIPVYYLGKQYTVSSPPWHYPLIMFIFTVPVIILFLFMVGLICCFRDSRRNEKALLIVLSLGLQLLVAALPGVPRYDGVRLFLNIFPFVALLAGIGVDWLWGKFSPQLKISTGGLAAFLFFILALLPLYHIRPFYLCYYNELAGGPNGANRLGLETTYWGDTCNNDILKYLNHNLPAGARVCLYPAGSNVVNTWKILGAIRSDLEINSDYQSGNYDYLVLNCRQGFFDDKLWNIYRNKKPVFGNYYGRLPLTVIYKF